MRIFVSSSFEDLREHRAGAIRVLRQLGHHVLAMEDMVAGSVPPLAKVLDMVDRSEAYLGLFAWRYGYVPTSVNQQQLPSGNKLPEVDGAVYGETSVTHYEYLRAVQRKLPVIAFLLDETYPWPPQFIDGFDKTRPQAPQNTDNIRSLRTALQQELVVTWFTTPSALEARVSTAVTMAGLTSQLDLQPAMALAAGVGSTSLASGDSGITEAIKSAGDQQPALKIDLKTVWWSTRLYLIACLAQRLTQARRILVVDTSPDRFSAEPVVPAQAAVPVQAGAPATNPQTPAAERFVGQLSINAIQAVIGPKLPQLLEFEKQLQQRPTGYNNLEAEIMDLLGIWNTAFSNSVLEETVKIDLTAEILRRWFGDALLQQPLKVADLKRASPVDLLRLLDYPNEYVPVLTRVAPNPEETATERVGVVNKSLLNSRLARSYLVELLDRERIVPV